MGQNKNDHKGRFYFGSPNQIPSALRACGAFVTVRLHFIWLTTHSRAVSNLPWGKNKNHQKVVLIFGSPNQIRTGVLALKGRCPRPLDDGAKTGKNVFTFSAAFVIPAQAGNDGAKTADIFEMFYPKMLANYNWHFSHCQGLIKPGRRFIAARAGLL